MPRRVYDVITDYIARSGGDRAPITGYAMMERLNCSTSCVACAVRELRALGFMVTTEGHRGVNVFALAEGWRSITDSGGGEAHFL